MKTTKNDSTNKATSDLMPFEHGEEGTHGACQEMLDKHGGKTQCCECTGHKCKTENDSTIAEILKDRCSRGRECADWHGICPDSVAKALNRKDEEWKEKVRGLRMEKEKIDYGYQNVPEEWRADPDNVESYGFNRAVDEFNKKLDELLK